MESLSFIDGAHVSPPRMESPIQVDVEAVNEPTMEPLIVDTYSEPLCRCSESECSGDLSESDASDLFVDEDNLLDDPEVDMQDFYLNIDDNSEWAGGTPVTTYNVVMVDEELELINTNVLQYGSPCDKWKISKIRNKIRATERVEKNDVAQVSDHFCILQTFLSSQDVKDRIYLHSIYTRR